MKYIYKNILVIISLLIILLEIRVMYQVTFHMSIVYAQDDSGGGGAPPTTPFIPATDLNGQNMDTVDQGVLAAGGNQADRLNAEINYLNSQGESYTITPNADGSITVNCANLSDINIPADHINPSAPPPAQPDNATPEVPPPVVPPPAVQPEAGQPPAVQPEAGQPPVVQPPAGQPPVVQPPGQNPPAGPTCNSSCQQDSECAKAPKGCNSCVSGKCQVPPACNSSCQQNSDCAKAPIGCNTCSGRICSSFNPAMCKCDGIRTTGIFPGESVTVTAKGKVEGSDTSKAQIQNMTFAFGSGDNASFTVLASSGPITLTSQPHPLKILTNTPTLIEYEAQWTFIVPGNVDPNVVYRIVNDISCQQKPNAIVQIVSVQVASVAEQPISFIDKIINFIKTLFGVHETKTVSMPQTNVNYSPTPQKTSVQTQNVNTASSQQLQLQTIYPAKILQESQADACKMIRFQFTNQ